MEVSYRNDVVLHHAVVAYVIIYSHNLDKLWAHFGICWHSWNKEGNNEAKQLHTDHYTDLHEDITCSVIRLHEAWRLVIDVFQFNANFQQTGVLSRIQSFGP